MSDQQDLKFMSKLYRKSIANNINVEFLRRPLKVGQSLNLIVGPRAFKNLKRDLYAKRKGLAAALKFKKRNEAGRAPEWYTMDHNKMKIMIPELQTHFDREKKLNMELLMAQNDTINLRAYNPLETVYTWLESLAKDFPDRVKVINLGPTWEGRLIKGISIVSLPYSTGQAGAGDAPSPKPSVLIVGAEHAREWITTAVAINLIHSILKDKPSLWLSNNVDWYIFPVVNPDGYEYTFTTARLWRRNKRPANANRTAADHVDPNPANENDTTEYSSPCLGVDLNRNWDVGWDVFNHTFHADPNTTRYKTDHEDAYINGCSNEYAGPYPFSEPETRSIRDFVLGHSKSLVLYLSLHSFGQMIMFPYAYTAQPTVYSAEFDEIGKALADTIRNMYGTIYKHGQAGAILYTAPGTSMDWVHKDGKVKYSMVIELRNTNKYTFMLPQEQIAPTSFEILAVLKVLFAGQKKANYTGFVRKGRAQNIRSAHNFYDGADDFSFNSLRRMPYERRLREIRSEIIDLNKRKRRYIPILIGIITASTFLIITLLTIYKVIF